MAPTSQKNNSGALYAIEHNSALSSLKRKFQKAPFSYRANMVKKLNKERWKMANKNVKLSEGFLLEEDSKQKEKNNSSSFTISSFTICRRDCFESSIIIGHAQDEPKSIKTARSSSESKTLAGLRSLKYDQQHQIYAWRKFFKFKFPNGIKK